MLVLQVLSDDSVKTWISMMLWNSTHAASNFSSQDFLSFATHVMLRSWRGNIYDVVKTKILPLIFSSRFFKFCNSCYASIVAWQFIWCCENRALLMLLQGLTNSSLDIVKSKKRKLTIFNDLQFAIKSRLWISWKNEKKIYHFF